MVLGGDMFVLGQSRETRFRTQVRCSVSCDVFSGTFFLNKSFDRSEPTHHPPVKHSALVQLTHKHTSTTLNCEQASW